MSRANRQRRYRQRRQARDHARIVAATEQAIEAMVQAALRLGGETIYYTHHGVL